MQQFVHDAANRRLDLLEVFGREVRQAGAELEQLRARLSHLSAEDFQQVEAAVRGVMNKLLHRPMVHLRAAAASGNGYHEVEAVRTIFGLDDAPSAAREADQT